MKTRTWLIVLSLLISILVVLGLKMNDLKCKDHGWISETKFEYGKVLQIQYLPAVYGTSNPKTIAICEKGTVVMAGTKAITLGSHASTEDNKCGERWFATDSPNDDNYFVLSYSVAK